MSEYVDPQTKKTIQILREFLRKQGKGKAYIRGGKKLFEKAHKQLLSGQDNRVSIKILSRAFKWLHDHGEITVKTWVADPGYPGTGNMLLNLEALPMQPHEILWSESVEESQFSNKDQAILDTALWANNFKDSSKPFMGKILDCLYNFRANPAPAGKPLYDVSAQHFLGSSKLLDFLSATTLATIGIDTAIYTGPYRYIIVAGKPAPKAVILVENPHAFETAVRADINLEHTWISAYGFGLSLDKGKDHGKLLENNIVEHRDSLIPIVRKGSPESLKNLFGNTNIFFWGDLDQAGLQIYHNIKKSLSNLKLSALYWPMLEYLKQGNSHPYVKAVGKEGQTAFKGDREDLEEILIACESFAVDQESIRGELIMDLCGAGFPPINK